MGNMPLCNGIPWEVFIYIYIYIYIYMGRCFYVVELSEGLYIWGKWFSVAEFLARSSYIDKMLANL
jgi:hypothetical protein